MKVLQLNRDTNTLIVAETEEDINNFNNVSFFYNVTHVKKETIIGWYDIYNKNHLVGFVNDVDYVKERW